MLQQLGSWGAQHCLELSTVSSGQFSASPNITRSISETTGEQTFRKVLKQYSQVCTAGTVLHIDTNIKFTNRTRPVCLLGRPIVCLFRPVFPYGTTCVADRARPKLDTRSAPNSGNHTHPSTPSTFQPGHHITNNIREGSTPSIY
jgi:hypothetical protein